MSFIKNFSHKALKVLDKLVNKLAIPYAIEYLLCYWSAWLINYGLLNRTLDPAKAAWGFLAAGALFRYYRAPRRQPQQRSTQQQEAEALQAILLAQSGQNGASPKQPSPYL